MPEYRLTTMVTTTVALQDFPNHRVRGDLGEKPALIEVVWFACAEMFSVVEMSAWPSRDSLNASVSGHQNTARRRKRR